MEAWTVSHFDKAVVCQLFGYEDVDEYYHDSSSQNYIPFVRTPSLFLAAADDPFMGRLPREECEANPHTLLAVTARCASAHAHACSDAWPEWLITDLSNVDESTKHCCLHAY